MRAHNVDHPVRGDRRDAQDDEEGNHVILVRLDLVRPLVEVGFPFREHEERGAECCGDEVAEGGAGRDATAGEWECAGYPPDGAAQNGEVHGPGKREGLQANNAVSARLNGEEVVKLRTRDRLSRSRRRCGTGRCRDTF